MLVLGIRTAPKEVRYALLKCDGKNTAVFKNAREENRLIFPKDMTKPEEKLPWLHEEFIRIFRQNIGINKVAIKTSEYFGRESVSTRFVAYSESIVINLAGQKRIQLFIDNYASIGTNRREVKSFAASKIKEKNIARWNEQMADAVAVAWLEGSKS